MISFMREEENRKEVEGYTDIDKICHESHD